MKKVKYLLLSALFMMVMPMVAKAEVEVIFPKKITKNTIIDVKGIDSYKFYFQWKEKNEIDTAQITSLTNSNAQLQSEINALSTTKSGLENTINNSTLTVEGYEASIAMHEANLSEATELKAGFEGQKSELLGSINAMLSRANYQLKYNSDGKINLTDISQTIANLNNEIKTNPEKESENMIKIEALQNISDKADLYNKCIDNINTQQNAINTANSNLNDLRPRLASLQKAITDLQTVNTQISAKQQTINSNNATITQLQNVNNPDDTKWKQTNNQITEIITKNTYILYVKLEKTGSNPVIKSNTYESANVINPSNASKTGSKIHIAKGDKIDLSDLIKGKKGKWTSSDESIATVDSNGIVTPKSTGTIIIMFISEDGKDIIAKEIEVMSSTSNNNVSILYDEDNFDKEIKIESKKVEETNEIYAKAKEKIKDINKLVVYDVNVYDTNNTKIQPKGYVILNFDIPESFDKNKIVVYRVEDNGDFTKLEYQIVNNKIQVQTNHFSYYIIAELNNVEKKDSSNSSNGKTTGNKDVDNPKTGITISLSIIILLSTIALVIRYYVIKKKKFFRV